MVLIFTGTYFSGDRNDRISRVHIFADSPSKMLQKSPELPKNDRIFQDNIFRGYRFSRNLSKSAKINTNKVQDFSN